MECPNVECRSLLDDVRKIVYKDEEGGVRFDVRRLFRVKAGWAALGSIITFIIIIGATASTLWWNAYAGGQRKTENMIKQNTETIEENAKQINELTGSAREVRTNVEWIKKTMDKVDRNQHEILKELRKMNGKGDPQ